MFLKKNLADLELVHGQSLRVDIFISFDAMDGCAKAIVAKCKEAGVALQVQAQHSPYGKDPKDSNIRIAPSFPTPEEMKQAADLFVLCVKLVSVEKLLENK